MTQLTSQCVFPGALAYLLRFALSQYVFDKHFPNRRIAQARHMLAKCLRSVGDERIATRDPLDQPESGQFAECSKRGSPRATRQPYYVPVGEGMSQLPTKHRQNRLLGNTAKPFPRQSNRIRSQGDSKERKETCRPATTNAT